jgi:hypothetical protein
MVMKKLVQNLKTKLSDQFIRNYRIGLFLIFIMAGLIANRWWNNANKAEDNFLKSLNLEITLKVLDVKPTGNHGYGVIYGRVIKSNKPSWYNAVYHDKYAFCKIKNNKVLFVSDYYVMEKNDSVIIHSSAAKYWVYRNGKLLSEYNLTSTTDGFLYSELEKNKYLEFTTYQN